RRPALPCGQAGGLSGRKDSELYLAAKQNTTLSSRMLTRPLSALLVLSLLGCQAKEQRHIFPGEPGYDVIPKELPLSDLFKESPKPAFSELKFVSVSNQKSKPAERLEFERVVSLLDTRHVFSRIKSISEVPRDPGQYIDYEINTAGLLNAVFLSIKKYQTHEIHLKSYIKEIVK
ncbi:MAG: hypothetical protein HYU47_14025, partial [Deltaproteobacteria bacterium]|nr:hypothetical protein [Deltaproteobacteria bacterium]